MYLFASISIHLAEKQGLWLQWVCSSNSRASGKPRSCDMRSPQGGFWSLCENSWIPAFAGMTGLGRARKSNRVTPAQAGVHTGRAPQLRYAEPARGASGACVKTLDSRVRGNDGFG